MLKEEHVLFPLIRRLSAGRKQDRSMVTDVDLTNLLSSLEDDHAEVGDALARMRELTDGYQTPANACVTYRAALDGLAELESDIHEHVYKENNILFPQTSDMLRRMARRMTDPIDGSLVDQTPLNSFGRLQSVPKRDA